MNQKDRMRMVLETGVSLSTVTKWDKGKAVTETIDRTLLRAASELGLIRENEARSDDGKA